MLLGWKIFRYTRSAIGNKCVSACNTDILPYGQTIFIDERLDCVSIYASPARQVEVLVGDGAIEVRLTVWMSESTTSILLEKLRTAEIGASAEDRCVSLKWRGREFSIDFYKEGEARAFIRELGSSTGTRRMFIDNIKSMCGTSRGNIFYSMPGIDSIGDLIAILRKMGNSR